MMCLASGFSPKIERLVDGIYPLPRQAAAVQLAALERPLFFAALGVQASILVFIYCSQAAARLRTAMAAVLAKTWLCGAAMAAALVAALSVIALPVTWYASYTLPHRFGLSRQPQLGWLRDWAIETMLSVAVAAFVGGLFFAAVGRFRRRWPLAAAVAAAPLIVFGNAVYPVYVAPLFNTYTPLPPSQLQHAILSLAAHEGISTSVVYEYDMSRQTTADNAYVAGIGRTERIAVGDNLLRDLLPAETLYVLAHEMGHYKLGHLWLGSLYAWIGTAAAIAIVAWLGGALCARSPRCSSGIGDPAALALIGALLCAYALVSMPIANGLSRRIEAAADDFAATQTNLGDAGIRAFARLGAKDLTPMHPSKLAVWFFYTHPPLDERIRAAAAGSRR
ncbi:MAG: M48 family metalloprotease [Candidatus Eremiobacteraeota bacterium]|nr:M48 family metalloprotease [Candidatus Eremiobacteraeota bacterium]